ncbi:hypothetical protein DFH09DRAFT_1106137 [Mycena vulgaris]|nr:hypothetical protein DFH09DRAFT_1106137 [Mycena vulgaris]
MATLDMIELGEAPPPYDDHLQYLSTALRARICPTLPLTPAPTYASVASAARAPRSDPAPVARLRLLVAGHIQGVNWTGNGNLIIHTCAPYMASQLSAIHGEAVIETGPAVLEVDAPWIPVVVHGITAQPLVESLKHQQEGFWTALEATGNGPVEVKSVRILCREEDYGAHEELSCPPPGPSPLLTLHTQQTSHNAHQRLRPSTALCSPKDMITSPAKAQNTYTFDYLDCNGVEVWLTYYFPVIRTEGGAPGSESAGVVAFIREHLVDLGEDPWTPPGQYEDLEAQITPKASEVADSGSEICADTGQSSAAEWTGPGRGRSGLARIPGYRLDDIPLLDVDLGLGEILLSAGPVLWDQFENFDQSFLRCIGTTAAHPKYS